MLCLVRAKKATQRSLALCNMNKYIPLTETKGPNLKAPDYKTSFFIFYAVDSRANLCPDDNTYA